MINPLYSMAFMTGLLGSAHCIGMCGGLVSALSMTPDQRSGSPLFLVLYNLGRTLTYGLIGLVVGWLGSLMALKGSLQDVTRILLIGTDILVILVGLGSAGLFAKLNLLSLEFDGPIHTMSKAVRNIRTLPGYLSGLPLGILFGFLPCGMLYAMALTAAQSNSSLHGALVMIAFGLGTAPSLFLVGSAASWFKARRGWMLKTAGIMVALMGCYNLFRHFRMLSQMSGMH